MNTTNIIAGIIVILILCSPFALIYWIVKKIKQRRGQKALNDYQELADKKAELQVEIDEKSKELSLIKDELKI